MNLSFPAKQLLSLGGKHDIGDNFFPVSATNSLSKEEKATFSSDTSVFPSTGRDNMSVVLKYTGQANGIERENALAHK